MDVKHTASVMLGYSSEELVETPISAVCPTETLNTEDSLGVARLTAGALELVNLSVASDGVDGMTYLRIEGDARLLAHHRQTTCG